MARLDQRITFEARTRIPDGGGGYTFSDWAPIARVATVWASTRAKAGTETVIADRIAAQFTTLFTIRNRSDIDETMRIRWGATVYNIRGIRWAGAAAQYLTIEAERGVAS